MGYTYCKYPMSCYDCLLGGDSFENSLLGTLGELGALGELGVELLLMALVATGILT